VTVVERQAPGAGASSVAAGLLAPSDPEEWEGVRGAFNLAAMADWPAFAAELEAAASTTIGYRRDGALRIALTDADRPGLEIARRAMAAAGIEHTELDADGVRAEEPGLRGPVAGLLIPGDAHVATDRLVAALAVAARRTGVRILTGVEPVAALRGPGGALEGVALSDGTELRAGLTVLATGAWSSQTAWLPEEVRPPVRPVLGEYVLLRQSDDDGAGPVCRRVIRGGGGSVAPRDDGRYWVGTTVRDAGYATLPRADAVHDVLDRWLALLPALGALGVERAGAGLRPRTPDGLPIVGRCAIAGLVLATGHGREGIMHAPLTGAAVAGLAAGEPMPPLLAPFDPARLAFVLSQGA
jgi:glycine oxidase